MERETITKVQIFPLPTKSGSHTPPTRQPHPPPVRWLSRGVRGFQGGPWRLGPELHVVPVLVVAAARGPCRCQCSATHRAWGWALHGAPPDLCRAGRRRAQAIVVGLAAAPHHAAISSTVHVVTTMASDLYASRTWQEGAKSYFRDCFSLPFLWI